MNVGINEGRGVDAYKYPRVPNWQRNQRGYGGWFTIVRRREFLHRSILIPDSFGIEQPTDLHVNLGGGVYLNTAVDPGQQLSVICTIP